MRHVKQEGGLFPHLTVGQNVTFGLDHAKAGEGRLRELLDLVSLDPAFADRSPPTSCRVVSKRAWPSPGRWPSDRGSCCSTSRSAPTDADLRGETRDAVRRLLDATGVTAIVVTHDREDAHDFADEVAVMDAGRVARIGPTAELYAERR